MTRSDKDHYAEKHPDRGPVPKVLAEEIHRSSKDREITCAAAFEIAGALALAPSEVGKAIDLLGQTIVRCQLGLFGYPPRGRIVEAASDTPQELQTAIRGRLADGRLPCVEAWKLAEAFDVPRLALAEASEALRIKISRCQLGAF